VAALRRWLATLRTPLGLAAASALTVLLAMVAIAPVVWGDAATHVDTTRLRQAPSAAHLLGTDGLGRDVLARVLVATRLSLGLALLATVIAVVVGLLLGTTPVVLGRRAGRLLTAAVNLAVAFPGLLVALVLAVVFGVGARGAVLAIGLAGAPSFARLTQTMTASVAGRDFVAAARVLGVGRLRLLVRHVLPNIAEPLIVNATLGAGAALLAFAGLSFLGLGVQPPAYDWGRLLNEGLNRIFISPLAALGPGVAVVLAGLAFNLFGEAAAQVAGLRSPVAGLRSPAPRPAGQPTRGGHTGPVAASGADVDAGGPTDTVLRVADLSVSFPTRRGWIQPVEGVSFEVRAGELVGVVGESGSGKTLTALAVAGLVDPLGVVRADRLEFAGTELTSAWDGRRLLRARRLEFAGMELTSAWDGRRRALFGTSLAMVFQDPMTSLNPALRVGRQLAEVAEVHQGLTRRAALDRAVERLRAVRIAAAPRRARQYPHELSGGMRQRAMIAMGLMGQPRLIIADEPTTALDVTVQRQILQLLREVSASSGAAVLFISHDIAVVSQLCERVLVMYAGTVVEDLSVGQLVAGPAHPYTRALLASVPDMEVQRELPLATIPGRQPDPGARPAGCPFAPRCTYADDRCRRERPPLDTWRDGHLVACWYPREGAVDRERTAVGEYGEYGEYGGEAGAG
jgi:peptide/nickel transport system ATP-binding protein/peptide/nickel transport system permease protein